MLFATGLRPLLYQLNYCVTPSSIGVQTPAVVDLIENEFYYLSVPRAVIAVMELL